jgi:hypothetical protein
VILTIVPRGDIREITPVEANVADVTWDDYDRAIRRQMRVDLSRRGDKDQILTKLEAGSASTDLG